MAAAVSGLSPVIITVRMPICRSCANRSRMPPLMMSFRWMTPSVLPFSATTSGVPPRLEMASISDCTLPGNEPPWFFTKFSIASDAPLRISRPSIFTPLMRV